MKKQHNSILVVAIITAFVATVLFLPGVIGAGPLEPPSYNQPGEAVDANGNPVSTMKTLQDIYDKLNAIASDVIDIKYDCVGLRFCDMLDGTVLDRVTGLLWLKNANCFGGINWDSAMSEAADLADGQCGLTDGSEPDDWRLPTIAELQGIGTDPPATWPREDYPSVPWTKPGSPFYSVVTNRSYWTSVPLSNSDYAYLLSIETGYLWIFNKTFTYAHAWPVRDGN